MLNIFYGRENLDKEKFIVEHMAQRSLLIVPDQFTLEAERVVFEHTGKQALMDIEVLSLSRLGYRLLEELGGSKRAFIDKYGRHMLLAGIAERQKDKLQVFRGMEKKSSFIEMTNNFISELKQYSCGTKELTQIAEGVEPGSFVQKKLQDLCLLYQEYEKQIDGKYTDSEDYIDLVIEKIPQSQLVQGNQIWVYGFDSFPPKTMEILGQLMASADQVNVVLTCSFDEKEKDVELFDLPKIVINHLEKKAAGKGISVTKEAIPCRYERSEKKEALKHIEKEIYALPAQQFSEIGQPEGIRLVAAANLYNEGESCAAFVRHLVEDCGYRYRDIRIICNDQEGRGPMLRRLFKEYGIELISDESRNIMHSPIVQYVTSLLDVLIGKFRSSDVIRLLKSGFSDLTWEEIVDLEDYILKYRIRGTMWTRPFVKGEREYGEERFERIKELRQRAIEPLLTFESAFKAKTNKEFIQRLFSYFYETIKLPEKVVALMHEQEDGGYVDFADETKQIWGKLVEILEQMEEIIGEETFHPEDFRELLQVGLSQVQIGLLPPTKDGLIMGTMQRSRSGRIKALLVVGANEGILPQERSTPGLFGSDEKDFFSDHGMEICKVDKVRQLEERMGIYRNLCKPTELLWMSYSAADMDGNQCRPSTIFLKMRELFPNAIIERDVLNQGDVWPLINSKTSGLRHLTQALQDIAEGKSLAPEWESVLAWYQRNQPETLKSIRNGISFTNQQERIGKQVAEALYKKDLNQALSLSPSRIERFAKCPFSHLIAYGLKPEERRLFEVAPREIGDIYHQCLKELTESLTVEGVAVTDAVSPWMKLEREECRGFVDRVIARELQNYKEGVFQMGNAEAYRGRRLADICDKVCWTLVEQVRAGSIESCQLEVGFGRGQSIEPIQVSLGDETIFIEGRIDRVDYLKGDRVKIIDYKTGEENFNVDEAKAGYRLQLMLYLSAAQENRRNPAGVFYFNIHEPWIDLSRKSVVREELEDKIRKSFRMNGVLIDDPHVIQNVAGDFSGYSDILPLRRSKEGEVKSTGKDGLLSEEEFVAFQEEVGSKVEQLCKELVEGEAKIYPMKLKNNSACTYCQYKSICRFDTMFEGCKYHII